MVDKRLIHTITACRICRSPELAPVMDLGMQALTGRFPAAHEPDPPHAPLDLVRCVSCGLVQLRHSVDTAEMFGAGYGYRSGITQTMRDHLAGIARAVAARAGLKPGDAVLDIGCNDGTLLKAYPAGIAAHGIDPAADMFRADYPPGMKVLNGFFDAAGYRAVSGLAGARAVTSISMFYDLEDPGQFVADVAAILAPDGVWVLEQSYLPTMLARNAFDTICHEHLEYYALAQIERLAAAHGLRVFDVSLNAINGGSFQLWVCHAGAPHAANDAALAALRDSEQALGLATDAPFEAFRRRVADIGARLKALISGEVAAGKVFYAYGASTKGNVLLQHYGLDHRLIAGCADKNPEKWGKRTPGTAIPITSEAEAREKADYFLVLPWHFRDEFIRREADFTARGGKMIFPLPDFEIR